MVNCRSNRCCYCRSHLRGDAGQLDTMVRSNLFGTVQRIYNPIWILLRDLLWELLCHFYCVRSVRRIFRWGTPVNTPVTGVLAVERPSHAPFRTSTGHLEGSLFTLLFLSLSTDQVE